MYLIPQPLDPQLVFVVWMVQLPDTGASHYLLDEAVAVHRVY